MARPASPQPDRLPEELRATKGMLDQRWIELSKALAMTLAMPMDGRALRVEVDYQSSQAWAGLIGTECERVTRNRGGTTLVAPLCEIPGGLTSWLGWQEVWEVTVGPKPYRFRNAGLTVYLGKRYEATKPQILRLEWPGISTWSGGELSFQSPGAGHPHWQFDLLEALAQTASEANFIPDAEEVVEDFDAAPPERSTIELLSKFSIERMHLASAAPWWLSPKPGGSAHHMNAPPDLPSLTRWLEQSVLYLRQELQRCVITA
ncbi:hypothetical protein [Sphingobium yanoikuyae]|uniref:hypothetical protein n=1 Tax=Sphingobium yanoikuyae TaxID=13690 RepID=UPI0024200B6C|nr:hypothetical protein [Sphingobium yanoikuyae]